MAFLALEIAATSKIFHKNNFNIISTCEIKFFKDKYLESYFCEFFFSSANREGSVKGDLF
jgi:hypothetical protein